MKFPLHSINITTAVLRSFVVIFVEIRTVPSSRFDTDTDTGADLEGVTKVTSHPPLARQPISCYYYACDVSYFDVNSQTLKLHAPVSPDPLNARSLRSLGFPKSPPSTKFWIRQCTHRATAKLLAYRARRASRGYSSDQWRRQEGRGEASPHMGGRPKIM